MIPDITCGTLATHKQNAANLNNLHMINQSVGSGDILNNIHLTYNLADESSVFISRELGIFMAVSCFVGKSAVVTGAARGNYHLSIFNF